MTEHESQSSLSPNDHPDIEIRMGTDRNETTGIENYELTTSGFLFNPKEAFSIAHELNKDLKENERITLEIYPTLDRGILGTVRGIGERFGYQLPIPPTVDEDAVRSWQKEFPLAQVSRVHLPFSYNKHELLTRPIDEKGLGRKVRSMPWIVYFGAATNKKGIELAQALDADITAHTNVVEGFAQDGKLDELTVPGLHVLAENEMEYDSPILKDKRAISDPIYIAENIVEKYNLDGLLLGLDHALEQGVDIHKVLDTPSIHKHTRAIHLADVNHGAVITGNEQIEKLIQHIGRTTFDHPVRAALDLNPLELGKLTERERFQLIKSTIDWIKDNQYTSA